MKKIKLIPALAMVALLAGCNGSKSLSIKAPKFAKEGKEVEFSAWKEGLSDENLFGILSTYEFKEMSSTVLNVSFANKSSTKIKEGKKVVLEKDQQALEQLVLKSDLENDRINVQMEEREILNAKSEGGSDNSSEVYKSTMQYQTCQVDGKLSLVMVDVENEAYDNWGEISKEEAHEELQYGTMSMIFGYGFDSSVFTFLNNFDSYSDEEKALYKFYQNGKIFTLTYEDKSTNEQKDDDDNVVYTSEFEFAWKYQIDATNGASYSFKSAYDAKDVTTLKQNYTLDGRAVLAGSIVESKDSEYYEMTNKLQKVEVKEIDISKFHTSSAIQYTNR